MPETVPGGVYRVDDKYVDADGKEVEAPEEASADDTQEQRMRAPNDDLLIGGEPARPASAPADTSGNGGLLEGVRFASAQARTAAEEGALVAADFEGRKASSTDGFTKPDVMALIESQNDGEEG